MRLGIFVGYWGSSMHDDLALVQEADRLGYHSVWTAEAYGSDAVTPMAWFAARTSQIKVGSAVMQMPARSPAMTAMTVATLDHLSGGRVLLGLGVSGPQVVEGWHGVPYGKPLGRSREYVEIVRQVLRRSGPLQHQGAHYSIPNVGDGTTGLGKPLKLITHPLRTEVPIYLAAVGPKNVALSAEIADGWLPAFYSPARADEIWGSALDEGFAHDGARPRQTFDIAPAATAAVTDDIGVVRDRIRPSIALYLGGMGARGKNFYAELVTRYGYGEVVARIQDAYLAGDRTAAAAAVPDALVDELNLIGTRHQIRDRLDVYRDAGVTTLLVSTTDLHTLRTLPELL